MILQTLELLASLCFFTAPLPEVNHTASLQLWVQLHLQCPLVENSLYLHLTVSGELRGLNTKRTKGVNHTDSISNFMSFWPCMANPLMAPAVTNQKSECRKADCKLRKSWKLTTKLLKTTFTITTLITIDCFFPLFRSRQHSWPQFNFTVKKIK